MGKKKKLEKKLIKQQKKTALKQLIPESCKTKCCKKFKKCEAKRCASCPCFDLMKSVA